MSCCRRRDNYDGCIQCSELYRQRNGLLEALHMHTS